jgi:subtilisin-like proprotein convertase family protein
VTTSTIDVTGAGKVFDLNVELDITHTYDGQLTATLLAPDGTPVVLFSNVGGSGDNFTATGFDEAAATPITAGSPPFDGTFQPQGSLAAFNDLDAAGTWTLEISDNAKGETGTLNSWSIEVAAYLPPAVPGITVEPTSGLVTAEDGSSDTFTVVLDSRPDGVVSIAVSSSNTDEGTVSPDSLTFDSTNWSTPQTVTVTGVDDEVEDGNVAYTIILDIDPASTTDPDYSVLDPADVAVTNLDDDAAELFFQSTDVPKTIADPHPRKGPRDIESQLAISGTGALAGLFDVDVSITHSSMSDLTMTLTSPEGRVKPLTFDGAEWNLGATTDFWGQSLDGTWVLTTTDHVDNGVTGTLQNWSITVSPLTGPGVTVTPTSGLTTSESGATASFYVILDSQPTGIVRVNLIPDDTTEARLEQANSDDVTLEFDPAIWDIPQEVIVIGVDDILLDGDIDYLIIITVSETDDPAYWEIDPDDVELTNLDDGEAPLLADFGGGSASGGVTYDEVQQVTSHAITIWSAHLGMPVRNDIQIHLADLPSGRLGQADQHSIVLDVNANGAGWFVDSSPGDPSEFLGFSSRASGLVDLLTVVVHEVGHVLGFSHSLDTRDVMAAELGLGMRRLPGGVQYALADGLILSPITPSSLRDVDYSADALDLPTIVDLASQSKTSIVVAQPPRTTRSPEARLLHEAADEAMQLIDDELLDLLALSDA